MLFFICFVCLVALGPLLIPAGAICEAKNISPGWTSLFSRSWESIFQSGLCLSMSPDSIPAWASGPPGLAVQCLWKEGRGERDSSPGDREDSPWLLVSRTPVQSGKEGAYLGCFLLWFGIHEMPGLDLLVVWGLEWELEDVRNCHSVVPPVLWSLASLPSSFHLSLSSYVCLLCHR